MTQIENELKQFPYSQEDLLAFIDEKSCLFTKLQRHYVNKRFSFSSIQASRDFSDILDEELAESGYEVTENQRSQLINLFAIHHLKIIHHAGIQAKFRMKGNRIETCSGAAVAVYLLKLFGVDCSRASSLDPEECQIALQNIEPWVNLENPELLSYKRTKGFE